ncbi:MAG: HugZ family protein [Puniceicoccales bacterium]
MTKTEASPSSPTSDLDKIQDHYEQLLGSFQSVQLATVDAQSAPTASYSPAVLDDERNFYIYVSEIAGHTDNLLDNRKVSFMVIEDESTAGQLFARKRIFFKAQAVEVERGSPAWEDILWRFDEKFGRLVEHLKGMVDFHLFRLKPEDGRFVLGFGRAYSISADLSQVEYLNGLDGNGHRQAN